MQTGVDRIVENLGGSPEKNKTGVDKILEILENGGGGGGGLPSYTSADKGKVLALGDGSSSTTEVIVPEQTGEFIADFGIGKGFTVSNPNLAFFQSAELGDTCEAIVGGSSYTLTYANYNGTLAFLDGSMLYALVPIYVDTEVEEVEFVSTTAAIHDTATISATASVPSVEPKLENGAAIITIDSVTDANNGADWAIYVNGVELTSEDDVADYLNSIGDRPMVVKYADGWSGTTHVRATVLYRKYSAVVFLDAADISLASYKIAGYTVKAIAN